AESKERYIMSAMFDAAGAGFVYFYNPPQDSRFRPGYGYKFLPSLTGQDRPLLCKFLDSINPRDEDVPLSHVTFGETPDSFFLRSTSSTNRWNYRWHNLPVDCELAIQEALTRQGKRGFVRAVTLGKGGSWIVYGEDWHNWGGPIPKKLREALWYGNKRQWTVNVCIYFLTITHFYNQTETLTASQ